VVWPLAISFGIAAVGAVAWNALYPAFLDKLRTDHAAVWQELGCPKYIEFRSSPIVAVLRFLLRREYLEIGDASLTPLAAQVRFTLIATFACLGVYAAALAVLALGGR
jgi:hypothetical protein